MIIYCTDSFSQNRFFGDGDKKIVIFVYSLLRLCLLTLMYYFLKIEYE